MASYSDGAIMSRQSPSPAHPMMSHFPPPPGSASPNNAPFPPQMYPNTDPALQPAPSMTQTPVPQQTPKTPKVQGHSNGADSKEYRNRLRKACDSCSVRKVKCDEEAPCKACRALDIPCTFARPSKRRGPPNRHADAIKKQRMEAPDDMGPPQQSQSPSPNNTAHAAHALASFSQQQVLSAESIMPWSILQPLIDDYFVFIHPLVPVPHEPSFRAALNDRQDVTNPAFLALLASMIGCLTASFPRRARKHLQELKLEHLFPSSLDVVDRCHKVAIEAQGPGTFNRSYTIYDAIINYLQGITTGHMYNHSACRLYFSHSLQILKEVVLDQLPSLRANHAPVANMTPNGQGMEGSPSSSEDLILEELVKRTFWLLFTANESLHQLHISPFIPDLGRKNEDFPHLPLPLEVDDVYLTPSQILPQPDGHVSELVGFNLNVRILASHRYILNKDLFDAKDIERSLGEVKHIIEGLPLQLRIESGPSEIQSSTPRYPSPGQELTSPPHQSSEGLNPTTPDRASVRFEVQKGNIYASQLGARSYLVKKYFTLDSRRQIENHASKEASQISGFLSKAFLTPVLPFSLAQTEDALGELDMSAERLYIIKDFLRVIGGINQVIMEPNGSSFMYAVRVIGEDLLSIVPADQQELSHSTASPKSMEKPEEFGDTTLPSTFNHIQTEEDLRAFITVLGNLELAVKPNHKAHAEDEAFQLEKWADLRGQQERFARAGGLTSL